MGRTVSGRELQDGRDMFDYEKGKCLIEMMTRGFVDNKKIENKYTETTSTKKLLRARIDAVQNRKNAVEYLSPEFEQYSGTYVPTAEIFARTASNGNVFSA